MFYENPFEEATKHAFEKYKFLLDLAKKRTDDKQRKMPSAGDKAGLNPVGVDRIAWGSTPPSSETL